MGAQVSDNVRLDPDHLLDVIVTDPELQVRAVRVDAAGEISDHHLVVASLRIDKGVVRQPVPISYRRIKSIDVDEFERRLRGSSLFLTPAITADGFAEQLKCTVVKLLDELAPIRRRFCRPSKAATKWLSTEAVEAKRLRGRLETSGKELSWNRTVLLTDGHVVMLIDS